MIIDNAKCGIDRKRETGRPLNRFHDDVQIDFSDLFWSDFAKTFNIFKSVQCAMESYKKDNPKKGKKHLALVERILNFLLLNDKMLLQVQAIKGTVDQRMLKAILINLEKLDYIEIYEYFKFMRPDNKWGYRPTAIKPTKKLIEFKAIK